jgi:short-subunit dehydrogenase
VALGEGEARAARVDGGRNRRGREAVRRTPQRSRLPLTNVAVVTGASSGIGAAIVRVLAARGQHCVLVARREDRLRALAAEVGGDYEVCDVGDRGDVERMAAAIRGRYGAVHLLVNNAGIPGRAGFVDIDADRLEEVLRVNYLGSVWCVRSLLPALEAANGAAVVNVVSVAGTVAFPPSGPYSASKHAQLAFSRAITAELRPRGIRVHTVNPGFVETEGFPQRAVLANPVLRHTVIAPDDVARHVVGVLDRNRRETFVPSWYRVATLAQALAPSLVAHVLARTRRRPRIGP